MEGPDGGWSFRDSARVCGVMTEEQVMSTHSTQKLASSKETECISEAKQRKLQTDKEHDISEDQRVEIT